jgi:hypothetical protein
MDRRQFLGVVSCLGISSSGCIGQDTEPPPSFDYEVEIPPCPETPDSYSVESVGRFVTQFEKAYLTRLTLQQQREKVTSISVDTGEPAVTKREDGWLARFDMTGPYIEYQPPPGSNETPHADPGSTMVHYLVTEQNLITDQQVFRAISLETVDPREEGTVVQCPPQ